MYKLRFNNISIAGLAASGSSWTAATAPANTEDIPYESETTIIIITITVVAIT